MLVAGGAYVSLAHLPLQQALNGLLAALMFNIIYDVLLSQVPRQGVALGLERRIRFS